MTRGETLTLGISIVSPVSRFREEALLNATPAHQNTQGPTDQPAFELFARVFVAEAPIFKKTFQDVQNEFYGIDISPFSRHFTRHHVERWGYGDRLSSLDVDILARRLEPFPCIQSVEVLEHMRDPQAFLHGLRKLLAPGGSGFITAAITAPEADHIYLYWTPDEVIVQLRHAGFAVNDYLEERAYDGAPGEHVPKVAAFVVS